MSTLTPTLPAVTVAGLARDPDVLADRLVAGARGDIGSQAAIGLLVAHEHWLRRPDFLTEAAWTGDDTSSDVPFVWIDWPAAADVATHDDRCSRSSRAVLLIAAELAGCPTGVGLRGLLADLSHEAWPFVAQACATVAELTRTSAPNLVLCEGCVRSIPAGAAATHTHPNPGPAGTVVASELGVAA